MPGIKINTTFTNADLPVYGAVAPLIEALANLKAWFQADSDYVTLNASKIQTWRSRGGKSPTLTQSTDNNRSTLTADQLNGYSAAVFTASPFNVHSLTSGAISLLQPFSLIMVVNPTQDGAAEHCLFGSFTDSTHKLYASITTGSPNQITLNANGTNTQAIPITFGSPFVLIISYDQTKFRASVAGIRATDLTFSAGIGTAMPVFGAFSTGGTFPYQGMMSDIILLQEDVFASANAADLLLIQQYMAGAYGLAA